MSELKVIVTVQTSYRIYRDGKISSDVSRVGPVIVELAKNGREDIDWGKMKLAIDKLKAEH